MCRICCVYLCSLIADQWNQGAHWISPSYAASRNRHDDIRDVRSHKQWPIIYNVWTFLPTIMCVHTVCVCMCVYGCTNYECVPEASPALLETCGTTTNKWPANVGESMACKIGTSNIKLRVGRQSHATRPDNLFINSAVICAQSEGVCVCNRSTI